MRHKCRIIKYDKTVRNDTKSDKSDRYIEGNLVNRVNYKYAGFTLVELLIVGILISIFSTIALFNARRAYEDNLRKAAVGELYQLRTGIAFAYDDLEFYPKLNYLNNGLRMLWDDLEPPVPPGSIPNFMDIYGTEVAGELARIVVLKWKSEGYIGLAATRRGVGAMARGGSVRMYDPTIREIYKDWPADPYGNPYVMYILDIPYVTRYNPVFITSPRQSARMITALVSYGPDKQPGGSREELGPTPILTQDRRALRLYTESTIPGADYQLLTIDELNSPTIYGGYTRSLAYRDLVSQSGSDDIILEF